MFGPPLSKNKQYRVESFIYVRAEVGALFPFIFVFTHTCSSSLAGSSVGISFASFCSCASSLARWVFNALSKKSLKASRSRLPLYWSTYEMTGRKKNKRLAATLLSYIQAGVANQNFFKPSGHCGRRAVWDILVRHYQNTPHSAVYSPPGW